MHYSRFLMLILAAVFSLPVECKEDYVIPNFMANWYSAVEYCNVLGLRLAVLDSSDEQSGLIQAIERSGIYHHKKTPVWIGANDLANEGCFFWRATGKRVTWSNWHDDQPDNAGGVENCAEIGQYYPYASHWKWNDNNCTLARFFACE